MINNEESKLIFLDEPDKYYIGTKESIGDVDSGRLNVKGSFTFTCSDPYKYKITEKTFPIKDMQAEKLSLYKMTGQNQCQ